MIELTATPDLQGEQWASGYDGRHRLYTHEHIAFDALPDYREGGPATVTNGDWSMSVSSVCVALSSPSVAAEALANPATRYTLNASRDGHYEAGRYVSERHPLDGTTYASDRAARRAAFDAGIIAYMVYERDAARLGLPTVG